MNSRTMLTYLILLGALLSGGCAGHTTGPTEEQQLVDNSTQAFERFLDNPDVRNWYHAQWKNVKAVLIVPQLLRGAFVVGGGGGRAVLLARDFVRGGWSPPAFYTLGVGSFGVQAGADASELILIVQSFSALKRFQGSGTMKLGIDAGLTVGTMGEGGAFGYDIITFTSSKGAFIGMSLTGLSVTASNRSNEAYYEKPVETEEILSNASVTNPGADRLRATVGRIIPPGR